MNVCPPGNDTGYFFTGPNSLLGGLLLNQRRIVQQGFQAEGNQLGSRQLELAGQPIGAGVRGFFDRRKSFAGSGWFTTEARRSRRKRKK
jgi:hypothetical protein